MSDNVVNLEERRTKNGSYIEGPAKCLVCNHEWGAVAPLGTVDLECPECQTLRGCWVYPIGPTNNMEIYKCPECWHEYFMVLASLEIQCVRCGCLQNNPAFD